MSNYILTEWFGCNYSSMPCFQLNHAINSLWPRVDMLRHKFQSTLAEVMACCLTAPSHYLTKCCLSTMRSGGFHLRLISQEMLKKSILDRSLKITYYRLQPVSLRDQRVKGDPCCLPSGEISMGCMTDIKHLNKYSLYAIHGRNLGCNGLIMLIFWQ